MFGLHPDAEKKPDYNLPIPCGKVGIEVEVEGCKNPQNYSFDLWEGERDDSLRNNGWEWTTAGPMYGAQIKEAITELFTVATSKKWDVGYPRAGIHIHLDVRDLEFESLQLARLVANYMMVEHAMFSYAGDWRRNTHYCEAYEDGQYDFKLMGRFLYNPPEDKASLVHYANHLSKYQAVNLKPLVDLGTIEFRHLPTKFDVEWLYNWIKVILALKKSAMDVTLNDPLKDLSNYGPDAYIRKILGSSYSVLERHIDLRRVWDAVDNATALMAYGNKIKPKQDDIEGWDAPPVKPNPILEELLAKAAKKSEVPAVDKLSKKRIQYDYLADALEQIAVRNPVPVAEEQLDLPPPRPARRIAPNPFRVEEFVQPRNLNIPRPR